ncbi:hypothetical protein LPB86_15700 [Pedobacter sp. MC2016-14]|uniref:hypothetical protein n=1 Tax=Pedobacter sp. MC2016-14 TaxID=2897327 RepID=UPI001E576779|nr:hypothetical protein [Pedobacter sp. MC2016-14]MCD0489686.1 hypothetical protein [Pedobacter sp. MC2016-14]
MKRKKEIQISEDLTKMVAALKPLRYERGGAFYCTLEHGESNVTGVGKSLNEAIQHWEANLQQHLATAGVNDEIVQFVVSLLSDTAGVAEQPDHVKPVVQTISGMEEHIASIDDPETARQVREFYEQFLPSKKSNKLP